jgi:hypothetical protein
VIFSINRNKLASYSTQSVQYQLLLKKNKSDEEKNTKNVKSIIFKKEGVYLLILVFHPSHECL